MTPFQLSEFKRLVEKRTKGRWSRVLDSIRTTDENDLFIANVVINAVYEPTKDGWIPMRNNDFEFIAYCGTHADAIISRIENLQKANEHMILAFDLQKERIEKLEKALEFYADHPIRTVFDNMPSDYPGPSPIAKSVIFEDGSVARKALERGE